MSQTPTELPPIPARQAPNWSRRARLALQWAALAVAGVWLLAALTLVALRWIDPPTTAVQIERHVSAVLAGKPYQKHYDFVPLGQISPAFPHAVIAAEDDRFYVHHGFDWNAIHLAAEHNMDGGKTRGGSTLTQQLVKNLFFSTRRSYVRKVFETSLVPVAELVLGKQRILELYMNVVEWGPGVWGAEAAARYHFKTDARRLGRQQSIELACILPSPIKRKPERMTRLGGIVQEHMRQLGW